MCFRPPTVALDKNLCPMCGAENPLGARKCRECGATAETIIAAQGTPEAHGAPGVGAPKMPGAPGAPKAPGALGAGAPPRPPAPRP